MNLIFNFFERLLINFVNVDRYLPIQIDITNKCNLRCTHCYHPDHNSSGSINLEEWIDILNQYKKLIIKLKYRPWVTICGGEPLSSPFLFKILNFIKIEIPQSRISILTNGTLINSCLIEKFKEFSNLQFQVSLDGPDSSRHDSIRGLNNFNRALSGIRLLKLNNFKVNVLAILSDNTSKWLVDFFKLAKLENFDSMNFTRFISEGYGKNILTKELDKPLLGLELKKAYQKIIDLSVEFSVPTKTQSPLFELLQPGIGRSGKFWESITIDYKGQMIASSRSKIILGKVLSNNLENVYLDNKYYQSLLKRKVEICGVCDLYAVCGGDRNAAFAASGNFLGPDPGCWKFIN